MTKQEMFDLAYRGLHSQGWRRCINSRGECVYTEGCRHCAWGWVDNNIPPSALGGVNSLRDEAVGLAALLNDDEVNFAMELQTAHDIDKPYQSMRERFDALARRHGLTIPEVA